MLCGERINEPEHVSQIIFKNQVGARAWILDALPSGTVKLGLLNTLPRAPNTFTREALSYKKILQNLDPKGTKLLRRNYNKDAVEKCKQTNII